MKNLSGANFCFWVLVLVLCFWWVFAYVFALFFGGSLPEVFGKILLSGLLFSGFVLSSFGFFVVVVVVFGFWLLFFKRYRSGGNRTPPHTHLFCWFLFLFCLFRPFWPCVLLLGGFSGCHSGPRAFLGFSWNLWGLSSLAPSEALFLGREAAGVLLCFSCSVFFFPFCFVLRPHFA